VHWERWFGEVRTSERLNGRTVFSWEGEDYLAFKLFRDRIRPASRFFVDIGAHHPVAMSNTYLFYKAGWRGINVDATPGSMKLFRRYRPEDVNLECAVGPQRERALFSVFADSTLNGILDDVTLALHRARGTRCLKAVAVDVVPVNEILEQHAAGRSVDLLNLDIEGKDIELLATWDFGRWRPKVIILEIVGLRGLEELLGSEQAKLLAGLDYVPFSRLDFSTLFVDRRELLAVR
jgi:FkbM family methyltransferase